MQFFLEIYLGEDTLGSMKLFYALMLLVSSSLISKPLVQTDYVIFVFDHGDKNMAASMLKYAEHHNSAQLS